LPVGELGITLVSPLELEAIAMGISFRSRSARGFLIHLACIPGTAAIAAPNFTPLGDFAGGTFESQGRAISADGTTVVGYGTVAGGTNGTQHAFLWTSGGGMQNLGDLAGGSDYSEAFGVNNDGSVVVGESSTTDPGATVDRMTFKWTSGGGIQGIGFGYGTANGHYESGRAVSNNGSVIVGAANVNSANPISYRWSSGGGFQALVNQANFSTASTGVSSDGNTVVGNRQTTSNDFGWVWTSATGVQDMVDLAGGNTTTHANDISPNGTYIVGYGNDATGQRAVIWTNGVPQAIASGIGYGVSDDGTIAVGTFDVFGTNPFLWDPVHGALPFATVLGLGGVSMPAGWNITRVTGVSADGLSYTGYGQNASHQTEAWFAHLDVSPMVPEPASGALVLTPAFAILLRRRRRHEDETKTASALRLYEIQR
jgi:probable HAF family extracellular repeat protein